MTEQNHIPPAETAEPTPTPEPTGKPSPVLVIFLIVPLLGILVALLMIAAEPPAATDSGERATASLVGKPAPFFEVASLTGEPISLDDYEGRTLFLNFWQTTCAPCVRELPAFVEFAENQGEDGAAVLNVNFDETSAQIVRYFEEQGIEGVPVALDPDSDVRRTYGVVQIPVTYIIAPDGTVRFMQLGEMTVEDMEEYAELVHAAEL